MISLNTKNLERIPEAHGVSKKELASYKKYLIKYLKQIEDRDQGFYTVIDDKQMVKEIDHYAKSVKGKYQHVIVVGIGGSALGTTCLREALTNQFTFEPEQPHLYILDNIDPTIFLELEPILDLEKTLFVIVSKSGTTPEVLSQFMYFKNKLKKKKLATKEHMVFVTDPEHGFLRDVAEAEDVQIFHIPQNVGGRFSVLTPVGLLPAALIGINIKKLVKGAQLMREGFLDTAYTRNYAFQIAAIQYILHQKGKTINVMMPYAQKLLYFASWYRQLLAESIGKAKDKDGKKLNVGITPVVALGVTDQHSQSQLYNEGPNDKLIMFLRVNNIAKEVKIPALYKKDDRTTFLHGVTFNELLDTEYRATADSYTENDRPNMTIEVDTIDEETIGGLFMLYEGATAFLGEFFNIDAFNQPGVERAKVLTKEYLQ